MREREEFAAQSKAEQSRAVWAANVASLFETGKLVVGAKRSDGRSERGRRKRIKCRFSFLSFFNPDKIPNTLCAPLISDRSKTETLRRGRSGY